jgi:hypothetical protein
MAGITKNNNPPMNKEFNPPDKATFVKTTVDKPVGFRISNPQYPSTWFDSFDSAQDKSAHHQ